MHCSTTKQPQTFEEFRKRIAVKLKANFWANLHARFYINILFHFMSSPTILCIIKAILENHQSRGKKQKVKTKAQYL